MAACATLPDADASARAVLIATVRGRDTGVSVLVHMLNAMPGYQVRGFAAGAGWVHLSEFAWRWLVMHKKMTDPLHPEYAHFSQFLASSDDGVRPETSDTDFRGLPELIRRQIKPAWWHFFNISKVMCGLRRVVLEAHNPSRRRVFGFMHAFDSEGVSMHRAIGPPVHRSYDEVQALRSLDLFLMLFPRGRVIVHLPAPDLPSPMRRPRCMCPGVMTKCRLNDVGWPDGRSHMLRELNRFARSHSDRALLTSASDDFGNATAFAMRLATFLGEPYSPDVDQEARKMLFRWANTARRDKVLDAPLGEDSTPSFRPSDACQRAASRNPGRSAQDDIAWCPPFRCGNASSSHGCTACPATLADWAWGRAKWRTSRVGQAPGRATHRAAQAASDKSQRHPKREPKRSHSALRNRIQQYEQALAASRARVPAKNPT